MSTLVDVRLTQRQPGRAEAQIVTAGGSNVPLVVTSLSIRGAQREVTGDLISEGYSPGDRWKDSNEEQGAYVEVVRRFRSSKSA